MEEEEEEEEGRSPGDRRDGDRPYVTSPAGRRSASGTNNIKMLSIELHGTLQHFEGGHDAHSALWNLAFLESNALPGRTSFLFA